MPQKFTRALLAALLGLALALGASWAAGANSAVYQVADPSGSSGGNGG
jgi:hypothetical protein